MYKLNTKDGIILTFDETISGVRNLMTVKNFGDNTFTMVMGVGSEPLQTFTFIKFVSNEGV